MAYIDYANELMGFVPKMSFLLAQKAVNRGWRDIRDTQLWSFQLADDVIIMPSAITVGTMAVTQFSKTVTPDATALAALAGLTNPVLTLRQIRFSVGPVYNIVAFDGAVITLDRVYLEATTAANSYIVYQCYYPAPALDFIRWRSVKDPITPRRFRLRMTKAEIDKADPQRQNFGPAYALIPYKTDATTGNTFSGYTFFEAWPHPQSLLGVQVYYERKQPDFAAATDKLPMIIPDEMLLYRARQRAYEWAEVNKGQFPELRATNWAFLMGQVEQQYRNIVREVGLKDREAFPTEFIEFDDGENFGMFDAKYAQSHDVWWT